MTPALRFGVIHERNLLGINPVRYKGTYQKMNCTLAVKAESSMASQHPYFSMVPGVFGCNIGDVTRDISRCTIPFRRV
jgi:hypothetical protein